MRMMDRRAGKTVKEYAGNPRTLSAFQFDVDSRQALLWAGGEDKKLRVWSLKSGQLLNTFGAFSNEILTVRMWQNEGVRKSTTDNEQTVDEREGLWFEENGGIFFHSLL
jgi:WD repeat-containing protein 21A